VSYVGTASHLRGTINDVQCMKFCLIKWWAGEQRLTGAVWMGNGTKCYCRHDIEGQDAGRKGLYCHSLISCGER
jgi:hypothetical protein